MRNVFVLLVLMLISCATSGAELLIGCKDAEQLINLVKTLRSGEWNQWNRQKIQGLWSESLTEKNLETLDAEPGKRWVMLTHTGRFTDWCECCETFQFELEQRSDGTTSERLTSVTIFHSDMKLENLIQLAQSLLLIIVPSESDKILSKKEWELNKDSQTLYQMYLPKPEVKGGVSRSNGADIQISRKDGVWTLYLYFFIGADVARY